MFGKIIGTGSCVPEHRVSNQDLSEFLETNDEWIRERTGIGSRRVLDGERPEDLALAAAKRALEAAQLSAEELDMIIVSTLSSNHMLPSVSCLLQRGLGAKRAMCFDLNAACTGFLAAYNTMQAYIHSGIVRTGLVVGAEGLSRITDWSDRSSCILFGDGAGAAALRRDPEAEFATVMHADGGKGDALTCEFAYALEEGYPGTVSPVTPEEKKRRTLIRMNGQEVFRFAIRQVPACIQELLAQEERELESVDWFLLHQANARIIEGAAKRLGAPIEKFPMNLAEYGNTSSASIPILLDELIREGKIRRGQRLILAGFGGGLTWGATKVTF